MSELPWVDFASGESLRGAKVSLPQWWEGLGKLADLAAPAIDECLAGLAPALRKRVPILLGVAAPDRPGRVPGLDDDLLDEICFRLGHDVPARSRVFSLDQAGCAHALVEGQRLIREGLAEMVVVAGVDSFLSEPTLEVYIERRRLMTPDNSNGFFPGEAGCAVLVGIAGEGGAGALNIIGLGLSHEEAHIDGTEPLRAVGMTQAVRQALDVAGIALRDVAWRITDLSGEHYKFKEAAFVAGRLNGGDRAVPLGLWHPIEYLGEIGAAILPCLLAWALHAAKHGYAPGALALCHVGSDAGQRAAMVVHSALGQGAAEA